MKNEKGSVQNSALVLLKEREMVFSAFKSKIFLLLSEKSNKSEKVRRIRSIMITKILWSNIKIRFYN